MTSAQRNGNAVVVGASMAGLLAARVLADTFARVTVVDRDSLPATPVQRRGVPQARHAHGVLARCREALEELFPGLTDDLIGRGAVPGDLQQDVAWYNEGLRLCPARADLLALSVSRPLLEWYVRDRVARLPGVTIVAGCEATDLVADAARVRVTGARLRFRSDGREEELPADLVVDATGRTNRCPAWLRSLGYPAPAEERVEVGICYATRIYRRRPEDYPGTGLLISFAGDNPTGGVALAAEGDRWVVTLIGMRDDIPPLDPDGFEAFAARLPAPDLRQLIQRAEPLGPALRMRVPTFVRRRYERLARFPAGLLVIGDAMCNLNPAYGQGMAVAASEALALRDCLAAGRHSLARRYFRAAARLVDAAWTISVTADLRFPTVVGTRTVGVRFVNWYLARLHRVARNSPSTGRAFLRVTNLIDSPRRLFAAPIAGRVLFGRIRR